MSKKPLKVPKSIELTPQQIEALLERIAERKLEEGDWAIIGAMAETIVFLEQAMENKSASIGRLLQMIFGVKTESKKNVLPQSEDTGDTGEDRAPPRAEDEDAPRTKEKRKGHGRNGADSYTGADKIFVAHPTLKPADQCPTCEEGKVYPMKKPGVILRVVGRAPLQAKVWELEKLRCNLCGAIFTAQAPPDVGDEKYDETAGAIIPLLKYGNGFPFSRLAGLQEQCGIPCAPSTQWEIAERTAYRIFPVYGALIHYGAQGQVIHNDDTMMRILSLMKQNNNEEKVDNEECSRTGIFTTGILSINNGRKVALFFTGHKHAGENLYDLLQKRQSGIGPPIQMCDALSRNQPKEFAIILAHCLAHARRKFVEVSFAFPDSCKHVIEILGQVYHYDAIAKTQKMSDEERLKFHQEKSGPLMENLKTWLHEQIEKKKVEPNSSMGSAIQYMLKHWEPLTLFLRVPNAPLDNNICEKALKKAILNRKNAYFYKTTHGAYIGDLFMSLIYTCNLASINPFDYLIQLQLHSQDLMHNPDQWLPWNYQDTLSSLAK